MNLLSKLDASVDFLRCHGAKRDAIHGGWFSESGDELGNGPIESAEALRRALHRADISSGKKRWLDGGKIGL